MSGLVTYLDVRSAIGLQRNRLLAALVHRDYLMRPGGRESDKIRRDMLVRRLGHCAGKRIGGEQVIGGVLGL